MFSSFNLFLIGSLNFVGFGSINVTQVPFVSLKATDADCSNFVLGATALYFALIVTYTNANRSAYRCALFVRRMQWPNMEATCWIGIPAAIAGSLLFFFLPRMEIVTPLLLKTMKPLAMTSIVFAIGAAQNRTWSPKNIAVVIGLALVALLLSIFGTSSRRPLLSLVLTVAICLYWYHWRYHNWHVQFSKIAVVLVTGLVVVAGYSTYRHGFDTRNPLDSAFENVARLPTAAVDRGIEKSGALFSGDLSVSVSLLAINRYTRAMDTEPFHTVTFIVTNWVPSSWWSTKPKALGHTLPRDLGRWHYGYVNWGPGIVGHGFHEGGVPMLLFYGVLYGLCFRWFDAALEASPRNPFLIAILCGSSGDVVALARGDIAGFTTNIIMCGLAVIFLRFVIRVFAKSQVAGIRLVPRQPKLA